MVIGIKPKAMTCTKGFTFFFFPLSCLALLRKSGLPLSRLRERVACNAGRGYYALRNGVKCVKGFTLLEVLIAMTVIAIAFFAVIKVSNDQVRMLAQVERRQVAHWVALQAMHGVELGLIDIAGTALSETHTTAMLGQTWSWTVSISNTENPLMKQVDIDVQNDAHVTGFITVPLSKVYHD